MVVIKTFFVKFIILSSFIHRTLSDEGSNAIEEAGHHLFLQSLLGSEEIISKELTSKIEQFIAPTSKNSTNKLCRKHSDIYIDGLRNGTSWAYRSK
jgi:hypothetical protein